MTKELTFEQQMERLNELVGVLEKNTVPLDEAILSFEEGLKLVEELENKLKQYESKVSELMEKRHESN